MTRPKITVGLNFAPNAEHLALTARLLREEAEHIEVAPETLWRPGEDGEPTPNAFHREALKLRLERGIPFLAHGVGLSVGGGGRRDLARKRRWLERIKEDVRVFAFSGFSDHLGTSTLDGHAVTLPVPIPMDRRSVATIHRSLGALQRLIPKVGVENSVFYFLPDDPLREPEFLNAICERPGHHLVLDLHNLFTHATNFRFDPYAYLSRLNLRRVIELHLSGGAESDPAWLPSNKTLRLDSHDGAVPEEVWSLLDAVLPRTPNLRAITLERMDGTLPEGQVPLLREELRRAKRAARRWR